MSRPADHNDEIQELIRRVLEGEETPEDRRYLEDHPEVASQVENIRRTRAHLVRSVDRIELPGHLAERIRRQTIDAEGPPGMLPDGSPEAEGADEPGRSEKSSDNGSFWLYSMVASLIFAVIIWGAVGLFDGDTESGPEEDRPIASDDTGASHRGGEEIEEGRPVGEILQVGMTDHMRCAVTFFSGDIPPASMEKMKMGVGEGFEDLVPIVENGIDRARLVVAHRCSFEGREYVHLVLKGEGDTLLSVAITERLDGEQLQNRADADTIVDGRSIFRTEIDGFEVAGFESGRYLIFVASNLSVAENLQTISTLVNPIDQTLRKLRI